MKIRIVIPAILAALLAAGSARAHDLSLEPAEGGYLIEYGHARGGHDHGAGALPADFVREILAFDADGRPVAVDRADEAPLRFGCDASAVCVLASTGFWCKTTRGTRNLPADEVEGELASWRSLESVKRLDAWSPALARPLTPWLEITPENDPFARRPGDKLRLLVTLDGRPVAGATVAYDSEPRGLSDKHGRVNIRVRHAGPQRIQAGVTLPLDSPRAAETRHAATLTLTLEER